MKNTPSTTKKFLAKRIKIVDESGKEITKDLNTGKDFNFSYAQFAISALNSPVEGLSTNEMRMRFKLIDKLEVAKPDQEIELDETEFNTLKNTIIATDDKKGWLRMDRDLIDFVDYIRSL